MKLNISFSSIGCQKLIEMDDEWKLHTSYEKHVATEVAADTLGEEWKGYTWAEPVAGMTNRVSPWSRVSWPMAESTCYWVRDIPITDQRGLEKESTNLYEVALWKSVWVFSIWSSWKRDKDIPGLTDITVPHCLGPKKLVEPANFSVSPKMMSASMCWESP